MNGLLTLLHALVLPGLIGPAPVGHTTTASQDSYNQVRIEQRVIVRISPRNRLPLPSTLVPTPETAADLRLVARKMDDCIPLQGIAAARPHRSLGLLLYLRDRRVVSMQLEKGCPAEAFYSGFYVERSEDGMLCRGRDTIYSRAGAKCTVGGLREMVLTSAK